MKTVSIISIVYGAFGLLWATMVTFVIKIQEAMMATFPWPPEVYEILDMPALLDTLYSLIGTLFPFVFLIALLYIISGIMQLTGKSAFKNLAYAAAILNILWYITYAVMLPVELAPFFNSMNICPGKFINVIIIAGMLINGIFYCAYPVFLIIFVKRGGKEWDTLDTGYIS